MKVGYQGNHGTFSEIAALDYFVGQSFEPYGCRNFVEIMEKVEAGTFDYAVIPVENTTTGIISRSYDLFYQYQIQAVGEINVPIRHNLITVSGAKIEEIQKIYSHPEALSQCQDFFFTHPSFIPCTFQDTARSGKYVKECGNPTIAAIGSWRAAEYYDLPIARKDVQDSDCNITRFLVVTAHSYQDQEADKTSLMVVLKHRPGSLYNILGILAKNGIDIVRLESRPIVGKPFEYRFYIDFYGNCWKREIQEVLHEMEMRCEEMKIIGCYKSFKNV